MSVPGAIILGSVIISLTLLFTSHTYSITGASGLYIKLNNVSGTTEVCMIKSIEHGHVLDCTSKE